MQLIASACCVLLSVLPFISFASKLRAVPHLVADTTAANLAATSNTANATDEQGLQLEQQVAEHYYVDELHAAGGSLLHVLVLTNDSPQSQARLQYLKSRLSAVKPLRGINSTQYASEDLLQSQQKLLPMTPQMRDEWKTNPEYHNNHARGRGLGSLACALGHYRMWQLAENMPAGKWAVILEDDAHPSTDLVGLKSVMDNIPSGPALAFLGVRHCAGQRGVISSIAGNAWGSTAYAVTAAGAKALLAEPFNHNSDHWLNIPINKWAITGFCAIPVFSESGDPSMMHN